MDATIWRGRALPVEPALVDDVALRAAAAHPHRPAVVDAGTGRGITFGELRDRSQRFAAGLAERGVGRGDVVSLVAANGPDYAVALYGALASGAAVASANPGLTAGELARQLARTKPRLVLADRWSRTAVEAALRSAASPAALHSLDEVPALSGPAPRAAADRLPDDRALLFSSSGTTGLPKVAVHTHRGTTAFLQAFAGAHVLGLTASDVVALPVPFTHLYGTAILSHALGFGVTVVTRSAPGFDLEAFLRMLRDHRVTVTPVTPPAIQALARSPLVDRFDVSALRLVISGAAPCSPELQDEVEARLGCQVLDLLGSTEAWCYGPPADRPIRGSVGTIGPNVEAVVVAPDTGARLGPDQPGELWIRAPQVMRGYLGEEETAAVLDGDGWLHTGDLCSLGAGGDIFLVDRLKELIKVGGYSVAPAEVEHELLAHPKVADAAVVGRPDRELGEVPVAYVALREPVAAGELRDWLQGRLAPWKHVRDVIVIERVPRAPTGKVLRRELVEREREQAGAPAGS